MTQTLQLLSTVVFVVAGVCLLLAIFLWFFFKIPSVIGDLTGSTARKSIARIREANEKSGNKSYVPSRINAGRGKITGTMQGKGTQAKKEEDKYKTEEFDQTGILENEETGTLDLNFAGVGSEPTGMLNEEGTERFGSEETGRLDMNGAEGAGSEETGQLDAEGSEETGMLNEEDTAKLGSEYAAGMPVNNANSQKNVKSGGKKIEIIEEVMIVHTDERI